MLLVYRVSGRVWGQRGTVPCLSHHVETVALIVGRIVLAPVGKASQQGLIIRAMVQLEQPGRSSLVAMLGIEHGDQGSDDARAVDHGSFADVISLQGQGAGSLPLLCQFRDRPSWRRSRAHRWQDHPNGNRQGSPSIHNPTASPPAPDSCHSGGQHRRATHRCRSTGRHSRSPNLPSR